MAIKLEEEEEENFIYPRNPFTTKWYSTTTTSNLGGKNYQNND